MAIVTLKVKDETKQLWVEAAEHEGCSLSEWIKRASMHRLGESPTTQETLPLEVQLPTNTDLEAGQATVEKHRLNPQGAPERTFRPDPKPTKQKKGR